MRRLPPKKNSRVSARPLLRTIGMPRVGLWKRPSRNCFEARMRSIRSPAGIAFTVTGTRLAAKRSATRVSPPQKVDATHTVGYTQLVRSRTRVVIGVAAAVAIGAAIGLAAFTFIYAKGASYLGNDPATCANCHVMREHYAAWQKSSHHAVAACNDCHAP